MPNNGSSTGVNSSGSSKTANIPLAVRAWAATMVATTPIHLAIHP
jgi:hypothetical protein